MEFLMLFCLALLIRKYIKKRSVGFAICHTFFFVIFLYLAIFTSNVPFVAELTQKIFGKEEYDFFREIMCEPCVWIYSTNFAFYVAELLLLVIIQIGAIVYVAKVIIKLSGKEYRRKTKPCFDFEDIPARCFIKEDKIYLNKCSLLI